MATTAGTAKGTNGQITAQPRLHQRAAEIQRYGTVTPMLPLDLEEPGQYTQAFAGEGARAT